MEILEKELSFYICESWKFQCLLFYAVCVLKNDKYQQLSGYFRYSS